MCDNGEVFSGPLDLGLSYGNEEVVLEDLVVNVEGHAVHQLVLEDYNWVGVANGRLDKIVKKRICTCRENFGNQAFPEMPRVSTNVLGVEKMIF